MATKPSTSQDWATDTNYSSGPASGNPTKVVVPSVGQALVPGDNLIPEYINHQLNHLMDWTDWLLDGSSAGAADAHVLETDANGDTNVQNITAAQDVTTTSGDVVSGRNLLADAGYIRTEYSMWETNFYAGTTWPYDGWGNFGSGTKTVIEDQPPYLELDTNTNGQTSQIWAGGETFHIVDPTHGFILEFVFRIRGVLTSVNIQMGAAESGGDFTTGGVDTVGLQWSTAQSDTNFTLVGNIGAGPATRSAGSTAPVLNTWYTARIEVATNGSAEMFINGTSEATLAAASVDTNPMHVQASIQDLATAQKQLDLRRIRVWQPIDS